MKLFKPEDYEFGSMKNAYITNESAAEISNKILNEYLETLPPYFGTIHENGFHEFSGIKDSIFDTHYCRLIDIQELKTKVCVHNVELQSFCSDGINISAKCYHCGIKLKAVWEAVK